MPSPSEYDLQRAIVIRCKGNPDRNGKPRTEPLLRPGVVMWHTPNGGKREAFEAKRLKEMGVLAGIPDIFFLWGGLYAMECKDPDGSGRLSQSQVEVDRALRAAGLVDSCVVEDLTTALRKLYAWGLTVRDS